MPGLFPSATVQVDERREPLRMAADDPIADGQTERAGSRRRLRVATGRNPDVKFARVFGVGGRPRQDMGVIQRRAELAAPGDELLLIELQEECQFFDVERVAVAEIRAEQWEGFGERAATGNELCATVTQEVNRCELLENTNRVLGAEHCHCTSELDVLGDGCGGSKHDSGGRDRVVGAVVFPESEVMHSRLVGESDPLDRVGQRLLG